MRSATISFHGFKVPLIGVSEDESLHECEDCHDQFDTLQMRLNEDGHFRCDKCTERDKSFKNKFDKR
jgi:ubiquitin C-terminal hydrolase